MRRTTFLTLVAIAPGGFATCGRTPATGTSYDCPDGRAFTVSYADSTTAVLTLDGEMRRLASATKPATRWTSSDSTWTLSTSGDTARVEREGAVVRSGCVVRNPELHRGV